MNKFDATFNRNILLYRSVPFHYSLYYSNSNLLKLLAIVCNVALLQEGLDLEDQRDDDLRKADPVSDAVDVFESPAVDLLHDGIFETVFNKLRLRHLEAAAEI